MYLVCCIVNVLLFGVLHEANGHMSLQEPPARNVLWRSGYKDVPPHPSDDYLVCVDKPNAPCPPCGDSYDDPKPRPHEAGGKWGKGIISRSYTMGQRMLVEVNVTNNHGGILEFRVCPQNNPKKAVEQSCLDKYPLQVVGQRSNKVILSAPHYAPYGSKQVVTVEVKLPFDLTCEHCVLQMTNIADQFKPKTVMFRNCADISIEGTAKTSMAGGPPEEHSEFDFVINTRSGFGPVFPEQKQHRLFD